jgi:hypothetical protein
VTGLGNPAPGHGEGTEGRFADWADRLDRARTGLAVGVLGLLVGLGLLAAGFGDLLLNVTAGFFGGLVVWALLRAGVIAGAVVVWLVRRARGGR